MGLKIIANRRMMKRAEAGYEGKLPPGELLRLIPVFDKNGYDRDDRSDPHKEPDDGERAQKQKSQTRLSFFRKMNNAPSNDK